MSISIELMKSFRKTARVGNITAAAKKLGVTQASLSWSIKKLEQSVNAELFVRTKRGVVLTRAGTIVLARSEALLRDWAAIGNAISEDATDIRGTYSLGVHPAVAMVTLPRFLGMLMHDHPLLDLRIEHDSSPSTVLKVIDHKLDFAIVMNPVEHPDLVIAHLYDDEISIWKNLNTDARSSGADSIVICNPKMPQTELLLEEARTSGAVGDVRVTHCDQLPVILSLVEAGAGMGILPATLVEYGRSGDVKPIPNSPSFIDKCCLIWRRETQFIPASMIIRDIIKKSMAN